VRHCLEKNPAERFHSARDLAFAIESLSGAATSSGQTMTTETAAPEMYSQEVAGFSRLLSNARVAWVAVGVVALLAMLALGLMYFNHPSTETHAARLSFNPPSELAFNDSIADVL